MPNAARLGPDHISQKQWRAAEAEARTLPFRYCQDRGVEALLSINLKQVSDLELTGRAREGDEDAFAEIVRRYSPRIFKIASRFFRRREQVEDIAQEVLLRAYSQLSRYEGRGSLEGWLSRITTNTCLNELRSARRHPEAAVTDLTDDETTWLDQQLARASTERHLSVERSLIAADLADKVLNRLPPDDRLALTLIDGDELSVKEVAEMTGWSQAKIKVQAFRARRRMRKLVEKLLKDKKSDVSSKRGGENQK